MKTCATHFACDCILENIRRFELQVKDYEDVLRFYADEETYEDIIIESESSIKWQGKNLTNRFETKKIFMDDGDKAREVLKKYYINLDQSQKTESEK